MYFGAKPGVQLMAQSFNRGGCHHRNQNPYKEIRKPRKKAEMYGMLLRHNMTLVNMKMC